MKDTKEKKNIINDNSNNENLLYVGGETLFSHICCGLFLSFSLFFCKCLSVSLSLSSFWDLFFVSFTLKVSPEVWSMLYI